jgi:Zn-dependent oligopeptidase
MKLFLFMLAFSASVCIAETTEQRFDYRIKTANIDSVFQKIIETAQLRGGYFTNFTESYIALRIPVKALQEFQSMLGSLAEIESRNFSSTDRSLELERYNSQIESRKKLLEKYMEMVKNAPFAELQAVEREMVNLNRQIENLQGQKLAIERKATLALVSIQAYTMQPPSIRATDYVSPFKWINSINLNSLRGDF